MSEQFAEDKHESSEVGPGIVDRGFTDSLAMNALHAAALEYNDGLDAAIEHERNLGGYDRTREVRRGADLYTANRLYGHEPGDPVHDSIEQRWLAQRILGREHAAQEAED